MERGEQSGAAIHRMSSGNLKKILKNSAIGAGRGVTAVVTRSVGYHLGEKIGNKVGHKSVGSVIGAVVGYNIPQLLTADNSFSGSNYAYTLMYDLGLHAMMHGINNIFNDETSP